MTDQDLADLEKTATTLSDLGCFDVVAGDIIKRTSPHSGVNLNTNAVWVSSPAFRNKLTAEKAAAFHTFAARDVLKLINALREARKGAV